MDAEDSAPHRRASRRCFDDAGAADEDGSPGIQDQRTQIERAGPHREPGDRIPAFAAGRSPRRYRSGSLLKRISAQVTNPAASSASDDGSGTLHVPGPSMRCPKEHVGSPEQPMTLLSRSTKSSVVETPFCV